MTRLRVGAVGLRLDLDLVTSVSRFHERLAEAATTACFGDEAPALLALPEHTGLLAMLAGERGAEARAVLATGGDTRTALFTLAVAYGDELAAVADRFPEATAPAQLLHLAVADTVLHVLHDAVGRLARERGWWVSAAAALPAWREVPDDGRGRVRYEPASPWVRNRNLVFGPDGSIAVQDKAYLVPSERDPDGLALTSIAVDGITTIGLPFGRLASVISKDAWMVDVNDRLDQLGAEVLLQPEAFDRWDEVDRGEVAGLGMVEDLWPPDKFQRGGWWMVQRHPSLRVNVAPVLVGRLGDLAFDGQASVAVVAPAGDPSLGLHGQVPEEGWAAVAPWPSAATDPPITVLTAEVELPRRVAGAPDPAASPPVAAPPSLPVPGEGSQLVPSVVAVEGKVTLVAIEGDGGTLQQLRCWSEAPNGWVPGGIVDPASSGTPPPFDRRWRPRLVEAPGGPVCLHLSFARESWDLHAVGLSGRTTNPRVVRVDDAETTDGVLRERGHDAHVVVRAGDELVAVWSDLRWPWVLPQVRAATSADGGRTWSASRRLDGGPGSPDGHDPRGGRRPGESSGQTAPSLAVADGSVVAAWQQRCRGAGPRTVVATRDVDGRWSTPIAVGPAAGAARWRPVLATTADALWLIEEVEDPLGGRELEVRSSTDLGASWTAPVPLDPTRPEGVLQARAVAVPAVDDGLLVVHEDHRHGPSQLLVSRLPADGIATPRRVDDAPEGADARSPAAVRCGDDLVVAWQDTRHDVERVRTRRLPGTWTGLAPLLSDTEPA